MGRPIKYRHPRTRLHTRILATLYTDLHKASRTEQRTVGELVEEAVEQWLLAAGHLTYRADIPYNELTTLIDTLPPHPHAKTLMEVFAQYDAEHGEPV